MCMQLLLSGVFYRCLLGLVVLQCYASIFFIFADFYRVVLLLKTVLKYPTFTVKLSIYPFNLVSLFFMCFNASVATIMFIIVMLLLSLSHVWPSYNPLDCSLPGFSVHGISQERILAWVAISFSRGFSWPRDQTHVSYIGRQILYHWATRGALIIVIYIWGNDPFIIIWCHFLSLVTIWS